MFLPNPLLMFKGADSKEGENKDTHHNSTSVEDSKDRKQTTVDKKSEDVPKEGRGESRASCAVAAMVSKRGDGHTSILPCVHTHPYQMVLLPEYLNTTSPVTCL